MYLEGVSLPVTFPTQLSMISGTIVDPVEYDLQKPDSSIVSWGYSTFSDYRIIHDVQDIPAGRSKLIVAPVVGGVRQCPRTFNIQMDADPMNDSRLQPGASTTWNGVKKAYDFEGTLVNAGGKLPIKYPDPSPKLPLLGTIENSLNAGLHVKGDIRLNGVVHIQILQAIAKAKIFNQSILDKSQDLIDDSVAHVYTDTSDWHNTRVTFVPVKLWEDSISTEVFSGPTASFWGIVTVNASLNVGLGGQVSFEGTLYPFRPDVDATEETDRLERIESRLREIEQENYMSRYDVVIKNVEAVKVASVRDVGPTPPDQGGLWGELEGYLAMHRVRPSGVCFTLYHDEEYKERDWDLEVCEPIEGDLTESRRVKVQTLTAATVASTVHNGPFTTLNEAYSAIGKWMDTNGYRIVGPCREVYLNPAKNGSQTDPDTVTEIQFPVEKV